jgi:116 kDa U5 small nuclear ribonucleoprotein component
MESMM